MLIMHLQTSTPPSTVISGFAAFEFPSSERLSQTFDLPVRILSSHPQSGQDTLAVSRGPIVYTAESVDNVEIDKAYPHFRGIGLSPKENFDEIPVTINRFDVISLQAKGPAYAMGGIDRPALYETVDRSLPEQSWESLQLGLRFVPWFARANRGGKGRLRTSFPRVTAQ